VQREISRELALILPGEQEREVLVVPHRPVGVVRALGFAGKRSL